MSKELSPIDIFAPRGWEVVEVVLDGASSRKEIAELLNINSLNTLQSYISGNKTTLVLKGKKGSKSDLGIYGVIEERTGQRPSHLKQLRPILEKMFFTEEDYLPIRSESPQSEAV